MTKQSKTGYIPTETINLDHLPKIKGHDFNKKFNFNEFIKAYSTTGFQATNLARAIEIIKAMRREKSTIFLSYTSNMVSSGVRETIRYLVEKKLVHVLITTAGAIEEDIIKTIKPFVLGDFNANGKFLSEKGINRIGNIFVTNDRYTYFEKKMQDFFNIIYEKQKSKGRALTGNEIIAELGKFVDNKESILYWAYKNNIPVFCPAIMDGSFGDLIYFQKHSKPDLQIDVTEDLQKIVNIALNADKTGLIVLGGGVAKHYALNAQIFREGCDFAVYINSASEYDGSDSGASTNEAVSWSKIKPNAPQIKVFGDATILFPLIIAGVLESKTTKK